MNIDLKKERDDWFLSILNDLHLGKYHIDDGMKVYCNSDGKFMVYDRKNGVFWLSYWRIWEVLEDKYGMEYTDIQQYTKTMLLEYTNWKVEITYRSMD